MGIVEIFTVVLVQPFFNLLIWITAFMPGHNVALAIIVLTLLVKVALFPVTHKGVQTQGKMRSLEGDLKAIREKHKNDKEQQARLTMKLYQEHGINPFSGCLMALIQLPIILGVYYVFLRGFQDGLLDTTLLYASLAIPTDINFLLFGLVDVRETSIILAILAGVFQFIQMRLSFPKTKTEDTKDEKSKKKDSEPTFADEIKKNMTTQMRYVLPGIIAIISLTLPSAVPLYWITSTLFSIAHELYVRRLASAIGKPTS